MGGPLSATGIDVQEILKVPEVKDDQKEAEEPEAGGEKGMPMLASVSFKQYYLTGMLDTMENTKLATPAFITAARKTLNVGPERKVITSGVVSQSAVSFDAMDEGGIYMVSEDTPVDLTGQVFFMKGGIEQITSDFNKVSKKSQDMVTLDFNQSLLIPSDMEFTVRDFSTAGVRALGRGYINSRGELALVDKADVVSYLHMKKSGGFSCLVSKLYEVP